MKKCEKPPFLGILGQNGATGQNLGKVGKYFFLEVFKNYFSQGYGHKFGQKCH